MIQRVSASSIYKNNFAVSFKADTHYLPYSKSFNKQPNPEADSFELQIFGPNKGNRLVTEGSKEEGFVTKSLIDTEGNLIWKKEYEYPYPGRTIVVTKNADGKMVQKLNVQKTEDNKIVYLVKYSPKTSNMTESRRYIGENNTLLICKYDPEKPKNYDSKLYDIVDNKKRLKVWEKMDSTLKTRKELRYLYSDSKVNTRLTIDNMRDREKKSIYNPKPRVLRKYGFSD